LRILVLLFIIFITSCNQNPLPAFKVNYKGALKNLMHKGDLSAKISLSEIKDFKHLYALGAVEGLKGEVLVLNSTPFISYVAIKDTLKTMLVDSTFNKKASLLVYSTVKEWESISIPSSVLSYNEFELYVEKITSEKGINTDEPFPFIIEGITTSFDWHVINWPEGDTEHSHDKHIHSGLYGTLENEAVEMLGFYSNKHHAIFTHHTTNMHIHVKSEKAIGHVDDIILGTNMILKLPK
jgi:acetolactate decarboxylase